MDILPVHTIGTILFECFIYENGEWPNAKYIRKYPNSKFQPQNVDLLTRKLLYAIPTKTECVGFMARILNKKDDMMKIYVKSTSSQGSSEYAWFKAENARLEPSENPTGRVDEDLRFYYNGSSECPVFYCSCTDNVRKDSWNRPIRNKLYLKASHTEQRTIEQLVSR